MDYKEFLKSKTTAHKESGFMVGVGDLNPLLFDWQKERCWEWAASLDGRGYGQINIGGKLKRAHRIAWELLIGKVPDGKYICHKCDNRKCVNPNHLFIGDALSNIQDMDAKGRRVNSPRHGDNHNMAVLNNSQVKTIKTMLKQKRFKQIEMAKMFRVGPATISNIKTGRQWRSV